MELTCLKVYFNNFFKQKKNKLNEISKSNAVSIKYNKHSSSIKEWLTIVDLQY